MKILFMGTPEIAVVPLDALVRFGEDIVGVVTQTDKPKGRGMTLTPPPVKVYAEEHGIPVFQPPTLKDGAFADELDKLSPEMIIVVAYGKLLPPYVLDYPKYGCVNAHGSLLPKYRGAAPMQRAIMNGETETGMCAMYMAQGLDTGDVINAVKVPIAEEDNFGVIHDRMAVAAAEALIEAVVKIKAGTASRLKQDDAQATYAAKIEAGDCILDFSRPAKAVHNQIRGLSPIPLCSTRLRGKLLKVVSARYSDEIQSAPCGEVVSTDGGEIAVSCGEGTLYITGVLPEGKKRQSSADFIRGRGVCAGDILG